MKFECFEEEDYSDVDEVASFETVLDPLDSFYSYMKVRFKIVVDLALGKKSWCF